MTPSIPILRNEINVLEDFRGGVKVARDFAGRDSRRQEIRYHFEVRLLN